MKKRSLLALIASASALFAAQPDEASIQAKVSDLLSRMTVEEKIGQLNQYSAPGAETGPAAKADIEHDIRAGRCGSMFNVIGTKQTRKMQELAVKESRLHIPLIFGLDVIHGYETVFPINLGQAASWDMEAIEHSERIAATEASAAGIQWTFAPMVDIARDPRWGRIAEGSGEDPFLGSAIARARVHGFQGDDLSRTDTILACAKHFAGYGASQAGRDYYTTDIPEIALRDVYLPPFKAALDAGVGTFMAAFNDLNGTPCSANGFLMNQVLRKEWGFKGFVVSDWMSSLQMIEHGNVADEAEACRASMNAGMDMDMMGRIYLHEMANQLKAGAVSQARLDEAVSSILTAKIKLGLFDDPYRYCDEGREKTAMLQPASLEAARDLARKSCVLLQNKQSALPLAPGAKIALIGPLADSRRDMLGAWQGRGRDEDVVTLRAALEKALPGKVRYAKGCEIEKIDRSGFAEAVKTAAKADVIIATLGESWHMSGEASSRSSIDLPGVQLELLAELKKTGKPVILVLMTGRPLELAPVLEKTDAVLLAWFPGTMGGPAITDLLTGTVSPSGKLPVTFPRKLGQVPIYYAHKMTGRPQDESQPNEKFKSNYLDVPNTPQFPFGFGLSYSNFKYSAPRLDKAVLLPGGELKVSTLVTNTASRDADEISQLYVRDVVGSVTRPVRELKGFQRLSLRAGESREITFILRPEDLAFCHADLRMAPEAGKFEIFVGGDSTAPKGGEFVFAER